jgi:superfamily I DNA and/or RNA helicase
MPANLVHARVGIVDKFQGHEVPIVIYSITASSQADASEGKIPLRTILLRP